MQIEINENENYKIEIPETVSKAQFNGMVDRLLKLQKFINSDVFIKPMSHHKKTEITEEKNSKNESKRAEAVKFAKIYYSVDEKLDKVQLLKKEFPNKGLSNIYSVLHSFKTRYNIKPEEIGMKRFPPKGKNKIAEYRL